MSARRDLFLWPLAALSLVYVLGHTLASIPPDYGSIQAAMRELVHGRPPYPAPMIDGSWAHPPGAAFLQWPAGVLPVGIGARLWVVASGAAVAAAVWLVHARTPARPVVAVSFAVAALSLPVQFAIELGNAEPLCLAGIAAGAYLLGRDRPYAAAAALGLAITLKPTAWPLLLLPALVGRYRATAVAIALPLLANGIGFAVIPHAGRFVTEVVPYLRETEPTFDTNTSAAGALELVGLGGAPAVAGEALAVLALLGLWWRHRDRVRTSIPAASCLLVVLTAIGSTYFTRSYTIYFVLAMPILAQARRTFELVLTGCAAYLLCSPQVMRSANATLDRALQLRWFTGYVLVLVVTLLVLRRRASSSEVAPA